MTKGKIWIDLDNSPHVPFFAPIIEELQKRNYSVVLTARDCFQVRELADLFLLNYKLIGRHSGKNKFRKLAGLCVRALELIPTILKERPCLAVSHGSRSQLIASAFLGIPTLFIHDYEFAKGWAFIHPTRHLCPELIPRASLPGDSKLILQYPGIKEDVYVSRFVPDPTILSHLGLPEEKLVAIVRPPASEAHYHHPETDELFEAAVRFLGQSKDVRLVALPRNEKQAMELKDRWPNLFSNGKMRIPGRVVNGLNLIWHSDMVISAGGTMNREAAALGVPAYSVFRGPIGAVDRYLSKQGRLVLLESVQDAQTKIRLIRRNRQSGCVSANNKTLKVIVDQLVAMIEANPFGLRSRAARRIDQPTSAAGQRTPQLSSPEITK